MALKPGAGKKLVILAIVGAAIGFGIYKFTGAGAAVDKLNVKDSTEVISNTNDQENVQLDAADQEEVDASTLPSEAPVKKAAHKPVAPKKVVKPATPKVVKTTPVAPSKPAAPKKVTPKKSGERENLELSNF